MIDDDGVGGALAPALQPTDDERRLHELGYAQELRRHMSGFSNFAVSFTIISILSGCLTLYGTGMNGRRACDHHLGVAVRRGDDAVRGAGDGGGVLELPDGGGPVLLVGEAGAAQPGGVVAGSPAGSTSWARSR